MLSRDTHIIAVCCAAVDTNYNKHYMQYFTEFADKYHFKILYFRAFSDLYMAANGGKHDIGESCIYKLINYNIIDGMVILSETIKCPSIRDNIISHAMQHNIPIVSIDHPIDGCYNINYNYRAALEKILLPVSKVTISQMNALIFTRKYFQSTTFLLRKNASVMAVFGAHQPKRLSMTF